MKEEVEGLLQNAPPIEGPRGPTSSRRWLLGMVREGRAAWLSRAPEG